MLTSSKKSALPSSCSPALFTAASTLPPEGAGEEWAESAGRGETLSSLLTLPVLALSASSSSLDRTTGEEAGNGFENEEPFHDPRVATPTNQPTLRSRLIRTLLMETTVKPRTSFVMSQQESGGRSFI